MVPAAVRLSGPFLWCKPSHPSMFNISVHAIDLPKMLKDAQTDYDDTLEVRERVTKEGLLALVLEGVAFVAAFSGLMTFVFWSSPWAYSILACTITSYLVAWVYTGRCRRRYRTAQTALDFAAGRLSVLEGIVGSQLKVELVPANPPGPTGKKDNTLN